MEKTFTLEEIKNYILSQDSMGDILYYLSEDNIIKANIEANELNEDDEDFNADDDE